MTDSVTCPYCSKPAEWVSNAEIYGRRYGRSHMAWLCRDCEAYVGCHQNTKRPLGTLANAETRAARKRAHRAIDPHWRSKRLSRNEVYRALAAHFGEPIHIGESDVDRCEAIIEAAKELL